MGMPRRTLRKRRTCGRWRIVDGLRHCCPYPKGHEQQCRPYRQAEQSHRRDELIALLLSHDSPDVDCSACESARRAARHGFAPQQVNALRCEWAGETLRRLSETYGVRHLPVNGDDETAVQP